MSSSRPEARTNSAARQRVGNPAGQNDETGGGAGRGMDGTHGGSVMNSASPAPRGDYHLKYCVSDDVRRWLRCKDALRRRERAAQRRAERARRRDADERLRERERRRHESEVGLCMSSSSSSYPFNDPLSGTTRVSRYQKGKTSLDFTEARDSEWQWHQLGRMQACTLLQTDIPHQHPTTQFLQAGCPSCRPTNSVKALKAMRYVCMYVCNINAHQTTNTKSSQNDVQYIQSSKTKKI